MYQFTKAVEQKQVAEQDAERAKFVVMLAEQVRSRMRLCCITLGASICHPPKTRLYLSHFMASIRSVMLLLSVLRVRVRPHASFPMQQRSTEGA